MDENDCMYCMQQMKQEQDPRKLPCGHVFCLGCLKSDCSSNGMSSHQCASCRRMFEEIDINSLPSGLITASNQEVEATDNLAEKTAKLCCDRCHNKPAVRYCIDCGEKSCAKHMEFHEGYYEGMHETLDIMKYAENPSLHNKAITCIHHKKECITMACKRCYQYNCLQCSKGAISCDGVQREHIYLPLASVEEEIKGHFDTLLQQAADKLVKIGEIEKAAWKRHDELLVKCRKMIDKVEKKSEEQIEQIRIQTEQLKASIQQYEAEKVDQVVKFISELMTKKEEIESVRMSTHRFLHNKHVAELIKIKDEKTALMTKTNKIPLGTCDWTNQHLRIGDKVRMEIELQPIKYRAPYRSPVTPFFGNDIYWS